MNLCDVKEVRNLMEAFNLHFRKEFGQNFLIDADVLASIAEAAGDEAGDENSSILEIGPGIGSLTRELAARYRRVTAVEIDKGLLPVLAYTLSDFPNAEVVNADVMKADPESLLAERFAEGRVAVCANLPYYITTPILMKLLESRLPFSSITVMVQKEVAERLCGGPGRSDYGAITASIAYYGEAEMLFKVPASRFLPPPKVDSAVVRIKLYRENPYRPDDERTLFRTIRGAFGQRRKTLINSFGAEFGEMTKEQLTEVVTSCGFAPDVRGERLGIRDFVTLSNALFAILSEK